MRLLYSYNVGKMHILWGWEIDLLERELKFRTVIAHFFPRNALSDEFKHLDDSQQCRTAQKSL